MASDRELEGLGFIFVPVWETDEVILYALVVYDDNDVVYEIDWGIYQHDSYANPDNTSSWIRSAMLQAGEFYFAAFNSKEIFGSSRIEFLLAPPSMSQHALEAPPPPDKCAVFIFLMEEDEDLHFDADLYLDGDYIVTMPILDSVYWYWAPKGYVAGYYQNVFTKMLVSGGPHELRLTTSLKPKDFHHFFECEPGRNLYVYPQLALVESEPWGIWRRNFNYDGQITVTNRPLESHEGWKRLLFYNEKWLGDD